MARPNAGQNFTSPVRRYYIDTRPYAPSTTDLKGNLALGRHTSLPLIHRLPASLQESIPKYVRASDRFMSLASALLKFYFIHKEAKIPWSEVEVARTPKPHSRPFWAVPEHWHGCGFDGLEFNVSHQAGMVVLVGSRTLGRPRDARINDTSEENVDSAAVMNPDPMAVTEDDWPYEDEEVEEVVRIGVDIACAWEPPRTKNITNQEQLDDWVDIFTEMFSERERDDMKNLPIARGPLTEIKQKTRRFYAYWALKEAYIKMIGEGLLASWLQELEFVDVVVPPASLSSTKRWITNTDAVRDGLRVIFKHRDISRTMHVEMEAFEENFLVATMTRGLNETRPDETRWVALDLEKDIRPCAEGRCSCLG